MDFLHNQTITFRIIVVQVTFYKLLKLSVIAYKFCTGGTGFAGDLRM